MIEAIGKGSFLCLVSETDRRDAEHFIDVVERYGRQCAELSTALLGTAGLCERLSGELRRWLTQGRGLPDDMRKDMLVALEEPATGNTGTAAESVEAVQEARASLVLRGDSLHAWSQRRGFHDAYVHLVLRGKRGGPRAKTILEALRSDGVVEKELAS